jgi:CDP-glucose 4,6-dehydratase
MNELVNFYKDKKVLITGNTGFKGSWLAQVLIRFGSRVVGYALKPNTNPSLFEVFNHNNAFKTYFQDIRDYKKLIQVVNQEKPEIVFHLAAQPLVRDSYDDPLYTFSTNVMGTVNVLHALKESNSIKSGIIITTDKVYENKDWSRPCKEEDRLGGRDPYSSSKACCELAVISYVKSFSVNANVASARAGNVIGGGDWSKDRIIPDIIRATLHSNQALVLRNPDAIRPWQHVFEPTFGYLLLAKELFEGKAEFQGAWNFAPEKESCIKVSALVNEGLSILGKERHPVEHKKSKKHETKILRLDAQKAKNQLGWKPKLDINTALGLTFDWYKRYYDDQDLLTYSNSQIRGYFQNGN